MAVRSSTMPPRRFASPALKALMTQRSAEFCGLILGLLGLAVLLALATYDPRDPSFNTASTQHTHNMAGPVGAVVSDLLLQGLRRGGRAAGSRHAGVVLADRFAAGAGESFSAHCGTAGRDARPGGRHRCGALAADQGAGR